MGDVYSRPGYLTPSIVRMRLSVLAHLRAVGAGVTRVVPVPPGVSVLLSSNDSADVLSVVVGGSPGFADPVLRVSPVRGGAGTTAILAAQVSVAPARVFTLKPGQEIWATGPVGGARPAVTEVRF